MQRFNNGDRILILPKFAHLYSDTSGVIVSVMPDPFRPIFTEYTIQFGDGSTTALFEFQLLEDIPGYRFVIADLVFDSSKQTDASPSDTPLSDRRIVLQAETFDISMTVGRAPSHVSIAGQLWDRQADRAMSDVNITLMKLSTTIVTSKTDTLGTFQFGRVLPGALNIQAIIPAYSLRIFGTVFV